MKRLKRGFTWLVEDGTAPSVFSLLRLKTLKLKLSYFFQLIRNLCRKQVPSFTTGFTLIEIMIVIAIFAVLMTIIVANIQSARLKSRDDGRISDIQQIQLAIERYYEKNRYYPGSLISLVSSGLLPSVPKPSAGAGQTDYTYASFLATGSFPECTGYHLGAVLESENKILNQDGDADSPARTTSLCNGATPEFDGKTVACSGTSSVPSGERCYDVIEQISGSPF